MRLQNFKIKMTRIGDWERVTQKFGSMSREVKYSSILGQRKAARKLISIVKGHLKNQDLPWAPLAASTIKNKGHDQILLDTYTYYNNIQFWQENNIINVGVKKGIRYKSGMEVAKIAMLHEISVSPKMPRRELWGPSFEEMGGAEGIKDIIAKSIAERMTRHFRGTPVRVSYKTFK